MADYIQPMDQAIKAMVTKEGKYLSFSLASEE
jgi:hypothetical protein